MRILVVCTTDSMISSFLVPYIKELEKDGNYVECACSVTGKYFKELQEQYGIKMNEIGFKRSPLKLENLKAYNRLNKLIKEKKFDTIFCHEPVGGAIGRLAGHKCKCKVIYMVHGFHFFRGASIFRWGVFYPIEKYLSKYTDNLITINKEDYELARKKFKKCKNVVYVPGVGIDIKKFDIDITNEEKESFKLSLGLKKDDYVLTYIARLDKNKNQIMAISIIEKLKDKYDNIKLLLVGPDELDGYYQKEVKEKGLEDKIYFLGYRSDIVQLLKITDIAISTSKREGLPVNVLEAMCTGIPIVVTNSRGNRDLINEGKNGYIASNEDDFTKKIIEIKENKKIYESMSKENLKYREKYKIETIVEKIKKIVEDRSSENK